MFDTLLGYLADFAIGLCIFVALLTLLGIAAFLIAAVVMQLSGWGADYRTRLYNDGFRDALQHLKLDAKWFGADMTIVDLVEALAVERRDMYAIRAAYQRARDKSALYFECHITLDPIPADKADLLRKLCEEHGFRIAPLLMEKPDEGLVQHDSDAFLTGRGTHREELTCRMIEVLEGCEAAGIVIRRYKIEDTLVDSRVEHIYPHVALRDPKAGVPAV